MESAVVIESIHEVVDLLGQARYQEALRKLHSLPRHESSEVIVLKSQCLRGLGRYCDAIRATRPHLATGRREVRLEYVACWIDLMLPSYAIHYLRTWDTPTVDSAADTMHAYAASQLPKIDVLHELLQRIEAWDDPWMKCLALARSGEGALAQEARGPEAPPPRFQTTMLHALLAMEGSESTLAAADQLLKSGPVDPMVHVFRGHCLAKREGGSDDSIAAYEDALVLAPEHTRAHLSLILLKLERNPKVGLALLRRLIRREPVEFGTVMVLRRELRKRRRWVELVWRMLVFSWKFRGVLISPVPKLTPVDTPEVFW